MKEGRDWEGRRRRGERGWEVGGKSGVRENVGSEGINVIASHEYIKNVHSGEEEEEEERQISGEEGLKERTIERTREEEEERVVTRVQWVEETGRRVRNSLLFLILSLSTPLSQSPRCRSDWQMDPGELCRSSTMNSTSTYYVSLYHSQTPSLQALL